MTIAPPITGVSPTARGAATRATARAAPLVAILLLAAVSARADEIVLDAGTSIYGRVLREDERFVVLLMKSGIRVLPRASVVSIARGKSAPNEEVGVAAADIPELSVAVGPAKRRESDKPGRLNAREVIARSNRRVELVLQGKVGGEAVDPADSFAMSKISAFLAQIEPALELVPPGTGAELRITLNVRTRLGRAVVFYGVQLGRSATCNLRFSLERITEKDAQLLVQGPVDTSLMAGSGSPSRRVYEHAINKLVKTLKQLEVFGIGDSPGRPGSSGKSS